MLLGPALGGVRHPDVDMWMAAKGASGAAALLDFAGQNYGFRNANGVPRWGSVAADMVFARASAAGRWPAAGPYEMVGSNVLRYDHDPVTRAPLGVRIEGAATNLLTYSEFPNGISDTSNRSGATAVSDIEGGRTGIRLDNASIDASAYKSASLTAGQPFTFSVFVETEDGLPPAFPSSSTSDPGNTFAIAMENTTAGINPQAFIVQRVGAKLWRVAGTKAAAGATGVANVGVRQYPTNQQRRIKVTGFQLGPNPSSYIPTEVSAVTRAAERLYFDLAFDPAADGITLLWDGVLPASSANFPHALSLAPPSGTNPRLNLYISGATMSVLGFAAPSGFWTVGQGRPFVAGAKRRIVVRLTPSALALSQNGDAVTGASLASAIPTGMTRLDLGSVNASNQWNSTISRVAVWRGAPFSDAQMQELSAL